MANKTAPVVLEQNRIELMEKIRTLTEAECADIVDRIKGEKNVWERKNPRVGSGKSSAPKTVGHGEGRARKGKD